MIVGIIFIFVAITSSVLSVLISVMHVQDWRKWWGHRVLAVGYGVMAVLLPILAAVVLFKYVLK